jgi:hypothetical protein
MSFNLEYDYDVLDIISKAIKKNRKIAEEIKKRISNSLSGDQKVRIEVGHNFISIGIDNEDANPFVQSINESDINSPKNIEDYFFSSHKEPSAKIKNIITEVMKELIPKDDS